ncbi:hypothetical protein [Bacteroides hominis]|uniref:hypothetical protein n=1 Tax=Bacteroides hominis TaxID=2763023 RepID=UPI003D6BF765
MGKLVFRVASDWQEVVRLRTEIEKLKQTLLSMDSTQSPDTFKKLNVQLGESTKKMNILISDAAKAGATMENDFKKGIYDGEKAVNSLSEEIIKQKNIIRETQNDVSMLTEQYKKLGKYDPKIQSLSDELNRAKVALGEQKYALGELQSQQALARLSTKALKDEYALFKDESKAVITVNEGVGVSFKKMLATIGGIAMLKQIASNVVSTAGMFQKYESVLTNALNGSSDKAKAHLSDINSFAAKTNFQLDELTDDFIKFVNRGVTPSMDAMKRMGDFTNTVAKPFDQLTEAILDINNPERWKEFGVRVQTEGNKVKLSFRDMTVECDRTVESVMKAVEQFGSMKGVEGSTEAIAKTIEGQMSNLEDTITTALAEIGLANQGLISGSISAVDTIVKNYDIIGKSVLTLIEIYGVYRAGLLINTIVEQGSVKSIWAKITATKSATVAQAAYNKVLAMNPYVAVGMAVVSLGVAVYTLAEHTTYAEKTARSAAESMEKMKNASENLKNKINELLSVIRDETSTQYKKADAYLNLQNILPEVFKNMDIEKIKLMDKLSLLNKINKASDMREIVGAKTNVVLAQKEVDKINALIAVDSQRGTYSGQYEIQLSDAKSKLEAAKKVVADIEKIQIEANKQKEKDDKKSVVKNKEHWTNQKKEAEAALNSIASSQKKLMDAGNFKGIDAAVVKSYKDNVKKLKEAEKELKVYDTSSRQESAAEKLRKQQEGIRSQNDKISEIERKQAIQRKRQAEDMEMEISQSEIDAMTEGAEKKRMQRELDNRKEIQSLERQKEDMIQAVIQAEKEIFDAQEELKAKENNKYQKKTFDSSKVDTGKISSIWDTIIENTSKKQLDDKIRDQEASWNEYLIKFGNYQQKRLAIIEKYDKAIKEAETAGDAAILMKEKANALDDFDNSVKNSTTLMGQLFVDASQKSVNEIQSIIAKAELLMQYLGSVKDEQGNAKIGGKTVSKKDILGLGISDNTLQNLELSTEQTEALRNAIGRLKEELGAKSPFALFKKQVKEAAGEIAKGGKENIARGIAGIGSAVTQFTPAISQFGQDLGTIFGNDDLGNKIAGISDALGGVGQTAMGVGQIMSGDIVGGAMSAVSGISSVVKALDGLFGADYSRYNEMKSQYEALNSVWDTLIDKKKEYIKMSYGDEAYKVGKEAETLIKQQTQRYYELLNELRQSGSSIGSRSLGKRIEKRLSKKDWDRISGTVGESVTNAESLLNLSAEQLKEVLADPKLVSVLNTVNGDFVKYIQDIVNGSEKLEDIQNQVKEQLTQVSFDSVFDNFVDTLMDMDSSAKDFANNFERYMQKAMLTTMLGNKYKAELQKWYDAFAAANDNKTGISEEDYKKLQEQWNDIVTDAVKERDKLKELLGWTSESSSQDSTKRGFEAMSQDTGEELNGRFTALQITGEEIKNQSVVQSQALNLLTAKADTILSVNTEVRNIADDTRNLIANSYLELMQISENTGAIVKPIQQMQKDIAEVKKNIVGLAP